MLLTACATTGAGDFCDIAEPIYVDDESLMCMTNETAKHIVAHNEIWLTLCDQ